MIDRGVADDNTLKGKESYKRKQKQWSVLFLYAESEINEKTAITFN